MEWGYKPGEWAAEDDQWKAVAIAVCIEKGIRQGIEYERSMPPKENKKMRDLSSEYAQWHMGDDPPSVEQGLAPGAV